LCFPFSFASWALSLIELISSAAAFLAACALTFAASFDTAASARALSLVSIITVFLFFEFLFC
jgi:hypothetical protein